MRHIAAGATCLAARCCRNVCLAQNFPTSPISLVNPYAAGGPADVLARIIIEPMAATLGQPIVLVNKPGGATAVAASSVVVGTKGWPYAPDGERIFPHCHAAAEQGHVTTGSRISHSSA